MKKFFLLLTYKLLSIDPLLPYFILIGLLLCIIIITILSLLNNRKLNSIERQVRDLQKEQNDQQPNPKPRIKKSKKPIPWEY